MRRRPIAVAALVSVALAALGASSSPSQSAKAKTKPKPLCLGKRATIVGTARANRIAGTNRADVIVTLAGNDVVNGGGGNDLVCGGAGADTLGGGAGADRLDGGPGTDTCRGGERLVSCEESRPLISVGALSPREYLADPFRPKLAFTLGSGWFIEHPVRTIDLLLAQRDDPGGRFILFDSFGSGTGVAATIARFAGIAGLRAEPPVAATVAGRTGQRFDALTTASEIVVVPNLGARYELEPNDRARFYAIDVGGATVTIIIEAPAPDWDAFLPVAEQVLATVTWGG